LASLARALNIRRAPTSWRLSLFPPTSATRGLAGYATTPCRPLPHAMIGTPSRSSRAPPYVLHASREYALHRFLFSARALLRISHTPLRCGIGFRGSAGRQSSAGTGYRCVYACARIFLRRRGAGARIKRRKRDNDDESGMAKISGNNNGNNGSSSGVATSISNRHEKEQPENRRHQRNNRHQHGVARHRAHPPLCARTAARTCAFCCCARNTAALLRCLARLCRRAISRALYLRYLSFGNQYEIGGAPRGALARMA